MPTSTNSSDNPGQELLSKDELQQFLDALRSQWLAHLDWQMECNTRLFYGVANDESREMGCAHCPMTQLLNDTLTQSSTVSTMGRHIVLLHETLHRSYDRMISKTGDRPQLADYQRYADIFRRFSHVIENSKAQAAFFLSSLDTLTNLLNRAALSTLVEDARRGSHELSVVMCDIDHFKVVNDTYGHLGGDKVLVEFAQALTSRLRPGDLLFRYGGEEFLAVFPDTDSAMACQIADRLRLDTEALVVDFEGRPIQITASFGCTTMPTDHTFNLDSMVAEADRCLYLAKQNGRNCVVKGDDSVPGTSRND